MCTFVCVCARACVWYVPHHGIRPIRLNLSEPIRFRLHATTQPTQKRLFIVVFQPCGRCDSASTRSLSLHFASGRCHCCRCVVVPPAAATSHDIRNDHYRSRRLRPDRDMAPHKIFRDRSISIPQVRLRCRLLSCLVLWGVRAKIRGVLPSPLLHHPTPPHRNYSQGTLAALADRAVAFGLADVDVR